LASVDVAVESRTPTRVTVAISEEVPMIFGGLFSKTEQMLTRQATAAVQAGRPVCLLVLNPAASEALRLKGSPALSTDNCTVHVNSRAAKAVSVGGSAGIDATAIYVVGPPGPNGRMSPKPQYNQPALEDPLKDKLPWPGLGVCNRIGYSAAKKPETIKPGIYCGGMTFGSGANVTMEPGVYVVQTGSIHFQANSKLTGTGGVTIIMLDPTGTISMQGGPEVNLQASTSGPWAGVVLAIKPQPLKLTSSLQGGGGLTLGGVVYMPTQHLEMQGGGDLGGRPTSKGFIVDTINIQGSGELKLAGDTSLLGQQREPRLVH
jgi:hypothetical protein